ncbi:MAG TPA: class I SAM-dependent methyltransferase, partial [Acidimicrobiia bacterium]|nr:class I SAM-dependent methyltransferase [Acidimicrobiia bacterium]
HAIERGDGPALELGCGNGRLLLRYRIAGLDVEGIDRASDMLAICRAHADAAGVAVTLHCADWIAFDLGRQFATIYNPAGSFMLIDDEHQAREALSTWMRHLARNGQLLIAMDIPRADFDAQWEWRVRRSATRPDDGVTFMVHEAVTCDVDAQIQHVLHRHEVWDAQGQLVTTFVRRHRLRWWTAAQLDAALRDSGAAHVQVVGTADEFVVVASVP